MAVADRAELDVLQKYGSIAFDPGQKAVLTSCVLSALVYHILSI